MQYFRSDVLELAGYKPGEQPQTQKIIKLNTNENPYPASPKVAQAVTAALESGLMRYPDPMGHAFRLRAAEVLGVEPDWILCGNGSDDLLTILTRALVGENQRLRLPYPSYILYRTLAQIQGARWEEVPFDENWLPSPAFQENADDLRLAFLPNPNSPTGTVVPPEAVLELAERLPCPLVVDEAYVDFAEQHCVSLVSRCDKIVVLRTLSKSYALAGLRFGYLVAQPSLVEQLAKVKDSYNCDALSIAGAAAAIDDQDWLRANVAQVVATRQRMFLELQAMGFEVIPSQANFLWCEHPQAAAKMLYERLKENGILVRYMNYENWREGLRISVGSDSQVDACLSLLKTWV